MEKDLNFYGAQIGGAAGRRNGAKFGAELREAVVCLSFFFVNEKNKKYDLHLNRLMHPMVRK